MKTEKPQKIIKGSTVSMDPIIPEAYQVVDWVGKRFKVTKRYVQISGDKVLEATDEEFVAGIFTECEIIE